VPPFRPPDRKKIPDDVLVDSQTNSSLTMLPYFSPLVLNPEDTLKYVKI